MNHYVLNPKLIMFIFTALLCADEDEGRIKRQGVRALDAKGLEAGCWRMREKRWRDGRSLNKSIELYLEDCPHMQ